MMQGRQAHLVVPVDVYGFAHLGIVQIILGTGLGNRRAVLAGRGWPWALQIPGEAAPPPHPGGHPSQEVMLTAVPELRGTYRKLEAARSHAPLWHAIVFGIPVLQSPKETLLISGDAPKFSLLLRLGQRVFPATLASRAELVQGTRWLQCLANRSTCSLEVKWQLATRLVTLDKRRSSSVMVAFMSSSLNSGSMPAYLLLAAATCKSHPQKRGAHRSMYSTAVVRKRYNWTETYYCFAKGRGRRLYFCLLLIALPEARHFVGAGSGAVSLLCQGRIFRDPRRKERARGAET